MADKDSTGMQDFEKLLLDVRECRSNRCKHLLRDSRIPKKKTSVESQPHKWKNLLGNIVYNRLAWLNKLI